MARFLGDSTVRFDAWIKQRTAEYRISNRRITKDGIASLSLFIKLLEYLPSTFDIHDSIFYIRFFKVSFSIKLAVFLASGAARMKLRQNSIVSLSIRLAVFLASGTACMKPQGMTNVD